MNGPEWGIAVIFVVGCIIAATVVVVACAPQEQPVPTTPRTVRWQPVSPPRTGLRCWFTLEVGHGVSYCEPDLSATHGASP